MLLAPLVLPVVGGVRVQVVVDAADESGSRALAGCIRVEWGQIRGRVLHAQGVLSAGSAEPAVDMSVWPPAGASGGGCR